MQNRLPKMNQIAPVYAVIAFMSFAWMILAVAWKLPSWLYFQTAGDILPILAYAFRRIFLDSLLYMGILLVLCMIIPSRYLKDDFIARGSWVTFGVIGTFTAYVNLLFVYGDSLAIWSVTALIIGTGLAVLSAHVKWLANIALEVADRLVIFLYVFIPVSLISMLIVFLRNIN